MTFCVSDLSKSTSFILFIYLFITSFILKTGFNFREYQGKIIIRLSKHQKKKKAEMFTVLEYLENFQRNLDKWVTI